MNIYPAHGHRLPLRKRCTLTFDAKTAIVIFIIGVYAGYIAGLWQQIAQKQCRIEIGLDENPQINQTYYERGQK